MTWLDRYTAWAGRCTDAPALFHKWGGYMAVAAALGRRLTFSFGASRLAPNLYVLLLAPDSRFRRSTALDLSRRVAEKAGAVEIACDGAPSEVTRALRAHPEGTLYDPDAAALLAPSPGRPSALRRLLADLHDAASRRPDVARTISPREPDVARTISPRNHSRVDPSANLRTSNSRHTPAQHDAAGQGVPASRPCVNLFAAGEPDWVTGPLRRRALGRFLTRCVLVSAAAKEKEFLFPPPADEEAEEALAADLADRVRRVQGPVCLDPVLAQYEQWAADFQRRARSPLQAALACRLQLCCLKVAIFEQVADAPDPVLTPAALDRAIAAIESVADRLAALDPSDQEDPNARDRARVARVLQEEREIRWSYLQRRTHLTQRRLLRATQALGDAGLMTIRKEAHLGPGRPLFVAVWQAEKGSD